MDVLVTARLGMRSVPAARRSAGIIALPTLRRSAGDGRPRWIAWSSGSSMYRAIPSRRRVPAPAAVLLRQRATAVITNDGAVHDEATPISAPDKIKTSPRQRLP